MTEIHAGSCFYSLTRAMVGAGTSQPPFPRPPRNPEETIWAPDARVFGDRLFFLEAKFPYLEACFILVKLFYMPEREGL